MLRQIELHGVLADKFGKSFMLAVSTPREACEALGYQIPGFKQFMMTAHQSGLFFAVFNDDSNIGEHELDMQTGASVIRIVPQIVDFLPQSDFRTRLIEKGAMRPVLERVPVRLIQNERLGVLGAAIWYLQYLMQDERREFLPVSQSPLS